MSNNVNLIPIRELEGYDLVESDSLKAGEDVSFDVNHRGTNTSATYDIVVGDQKVGWSSLTFGLRHQNVWFDIEISARGNGYAISALRGLAATLETRSFNLITNGVMADSRGYWQHMAENGHVTPVDPTNPETDFRVLPAAEAGLNR